MLSMTGYGRAEAQIDGRKWIVEIKSLNHRYIEIITRLPNALSSLEVDIKKRVGERIFRGRIEVSVQADAESGGDSGMQYSLNLPLLRNYHSLLLRIKEELDLDIEVGERLGVVSGGGPSGGLVLEGFRARLRRPGGCVLRDHDDVRWVVPEELAGFPFAPADRPFVELLRGRKRP